DGPHHVIGLCLDEQAHRRHRVAPLLGMRRRSAKQQLALRRPEPAFTLPTQHMAHEHVEAEAWVAVTLVELAESAVTEGAEQVPGRGDVGELRELRGQLEI